MSGVRLKPLYVNPAVCPFLWMWRAVFRIVSPWEELMVHPVEYQRYLSPETGLILVEKFVIESVSHNDDSREFRVFDCNAIDCRGQLKQQWEDQVASYIQQKLRQQQP